MRLCQELAEGFASQEKLYEHSIGHSYFEHVKNSCPGQFLEVALYSKEDIKVGVPVLFCFSSS